MVLLGYVVLRNIKFRLNGEEKETGFEVNYSTKRLYDSKLSAENAVSQMKGHFPDDEFQIHPVYWRGFSMCSEYQSNV